MLRFFGAFGEDTQAAFWVDFGKWELGLVKAGLQEAKLTESSTSTRTLNDAPQALVYHILTNIDILLNPDVLPIVRNFTPLTSTVSLPVDPPPPGMLLLSLDDNENTRMWARAHLRASKGIAEDQLIGPYLQVLEIILNAVSVNRGSSVPPSLSTDLAVLWSGVALVLRLLPSAYFGTAKARQLEIHRIVLGHLHDHGPR